MQALTPTPTLAFQDPVAIAIHPSHDHDHDHDHNQTHNIDVNDDTDKPCIQGRDSANVSLSVGNQETLSDGRSRMSRYFSAEVDTAWTDVLLIICGFVSGLVDGLSFNAWGSFSSMQTGILPYSPCMDMRMVLMITRKLRLHSPRRLRPTRQPGLPLGQIPHRPHRLYLQQPLLHPLLARPPPPPPQHPPPLLHPPNNRPPRRRPPSPTRRRKPATRRPARPRPMATSPSHRAPRVPGRGTDRGIAGAGVRRDPDGGAHDAAVRFAG